MGQSYLFLVFVTEEELDRLAGLAGDRNDVLGPWGVVATFPAQDIPPQGLDPGGQLLLAKPRLGARLADSIADPPCACVVGDRRHAETYLTHQMSRVKCCTEPVSLR